jgi:hypothetical protein
MYARKRFTGTVQSGTESSILPWSDKGSFGCAKEKTKILSQSIVETLTGCGIPSSWDEETYTVTIDGVNILFLYQSYLTGNKYSIYADGAEVAKVPSTSYDPLGKTTYPFDYDYFVTVKGDMQTGVHIYISPSATSNLEYTGLTMIRGKDLYENKDIVCFCISNEINALKFKVTDRQGKFYAKYEKAVITFVSGRLSTPTYTNDYEVYSFIPLYRIRSEDGYMLLDAYMFPYSLPSGQWFNFDNELYLYFGTNCLVKCDTEISTPER